MQKQYVVLSNKNGKKKKNCPNGTKYFNVDYLIKIPEFCSSPDDLNESWYNGFLHGNFPNLSRHRVICNTCYTPLRSDVVSDKHRFLISNCCCGAWFLRRWQHACCKLPVCNPDTWFACSVFLLARLEPLPVRTAQSLLIFHSPFKPPTHFAAVEVFVVFGLEKIQLLTFQRL